MIFDQEYYKKPDIYLMSKLPKKTVCLCLKMAATHPAICIDCTKYPTCIYPMKTNKFNKGGLHYLTKESIFKTIRPKRSRFKTAFNNSKQ